MGWTKYLFLNTTAAESTDANALQNISPTSSVFGGNDSNSYGNGVEQISYIWHDVPVLQKFGTYEGLGGTANGSFVELGFRPAIVWVKNIDTASQSNTHWCVFDKLRPGFNKSPAQNRLHLDTTDRKILIELMMVKVLIYYLMGLEFDQTIGMKQTSQEQHISTVPGQKHHQLTCMVVVPTQDNLNN